MKAWSQSDSIDLICKEKWNETPDSVSFSLASENEDVQFGFKPGQFCSLGFEFADGIEYRAYSISSLPEANKLRFTVKRVDGGLVSSHIVDTLEVGHKVKALKPIGLFNSVDCLPKDKVTMVSAGCGVTPVMTMVKEWLSNGEKIDIDFIHQARDKENTIYFNELEQLADKHENFHLKLLLKNNENTEYAQGRLDIDWLQNLSTDISERTVYLCGPVGFMKDVASYLNEMDFDMNNFYEESFTPMIDENAQQGNEEVSGVATVSVPSFGAELSVNIDSMLMEALETGSLPIIAACRSGVCGSCKVKVTGGEVERTSTQTLTDSDIEEGFVLACSCKIKSDVEVSLN